jgi:predicted nucleic acid-binding protein
MRAGALSDGFVLDASVALSWVFEDEVSEVGERALALQGDGHSMVPSFWTAEIASGLAVGLRRQRVSDAKVTTFLAAIQEFDIRADGTIPSVSRLLEFSRATMLSPYDAAYVVLAHEQQVPLASADKRMREVAQSFGVALI